MATHEEKYLGNCAAYVMDALDGEDLREFEAHLGGRCDVCRAEIVSLTEVAAALPTLLPQMMPPPELKDRILYAARFSDAVKHGARQRAEGTGEKITPPPARRPWLAYGLTVAAIIMIVGFSLSYVSLLNVLDRKNFDLATQATRIVELTNELQRKEEILNVLTSRHIDIVLMDGLEVNPAGFGKIIWDTEKNVAILQVSNLPPVPNEKEYQLWVLKVKEPHHPVSAGVFAVMNTDERYFKVLTLMGVERSGIGAFSVTLEPKGGVPAPTGATYLLGKFAPN